MNLGENCIEMQIPRSACIPKLTSMRNCMTLEVRFRALLNQDETQQLEVMRV